MSGKVWCEITHPFLNLNSATMLEKAEPINENGSTINDYEKYKMTWWNAVSLNPCVTNWSYFFYQ